MSPPLQSPLRREDERLLTGRARYVDNVHLDRMAHGVFIRSPMAHAEIVAIDASAALAAGALCVLPGASSIQRQAVGHPLLAFEHPRRNAEVPSG